MQWECDKLLELSDPLRMSIKDIHEWKYKMFKQTFAFHFNNCPEYKRYCELHNVKPEDIKTYEDLIKIQPIPSDIFRDSEKLILSVPENEIVTILTTSSTTSKKPVRYAIDEMTFEGMKNFNAKSWQTVMEILPGSMIFLTPSPTETKVGLVGGAYSIFKIMGFNDSNIKFAAKGGNFDSEKILELIISSNPPQHLYGPPFAYWNLVEYMKKEGKKINLDVKSRLITTGGWKGVKGEVSKEELNKEIAEVFGVSENQIRDGLGLTDIMGLMPECSYHKKHVPPWYHVSIRNPENINEEVDEGKTGLLVAMSAFISSYPAFTLPGDMGAVWEKECKCGITGQIVEHRGRASKLGARGCAIRLEEFMKLITKSSS
jgi:long-chain-fatty-acid---luciferin-component ligase